MEELPRARLVKCGRNGRQAVGTDEAKGFVSSFVRHLKGQEKQRYLLPLLYAVAFKLS